MSFSLTGIIAPINTSSIAVTGTISASTSLIANETISGNLNVGKTLYTSNLVVWGSNTIIQSFTNISSNVSIVNNNPYSSPALFVYQNETVPEKVVSFNAGTVEALSINSVGQVVTSNVVIYSDGTTSPFFSVLAGVHKPITVLSNGHVGIGSTIPYNAFDISSVTQFYNQVSVGTGTTSANLINNGSLTVTGSASISGTVTANSLQTDAGQPFKFRFGSGSVTSSWGGGYGFSSGPISFGYTFTSAPIVIISGTVWGSSLNLMTIVAFSITTTGFNVGITNASSGSLSGTYTYSWIAVGI